MSAVKPTVLFVAVRKCLPAGGMEFFDYSTFADSREVAEWKRRRSEEGIPEWVQANPFSRITLVTVTEEPRGEIR